MSHIFISYSKKDIEFARHLRKLLQEQGFAVWMDETRLVPSEKWWPTIERNIISCAAFVVIMSPNSQESNWVEREILVAEKRHKPIFPVLLQGEHWSRLGEIQYQDMMQGMEASLDDDFVIGLKKFAPTVGAITPPPLPETVIETRSVPMKIVPNRTQRLMASVVSVLVIGLVTITVALINQGIIDRATPTIVQPTDNVTKTIAAGVTATVERQTQIALAVTPTATFTATQTPSSTRTFAARPSDTPFNANDAIAATLAHDVTETANAIASYTKTPTTTFTASNTATNTPDIAGTVAKGVEESRTANVVASYTKMMTLTNTFIPPNTPTFIHMPTATDTFTPTYTPIASDTPTATNTLTAIITVTLSVTSTVTSTPFVGITHNADWTLSIRKETYNDVEVAMVQVPAGCFMMGSEIGYPDEKPVHRVCFNEPFWIDRYEVTNALYGSSGEFKDLRQPRENIDWIDANAFCANRNARLPTEAEWEYAGRGPDDLNFPWGNDIDPKKYIGGWNSPDRTANVGSKSNGASWVGAFDMSGNVSEWVADWYGSYTIEDQMNPKGSPEGTTRIMRGGSWFDRSGWKSDKRLSNRVNKPPTFKANDVGFRCVHN